MTELPDRDEFIAFWEADESFRWRQLVPYGVYIGILLLYAVLLRVLDLQWYLLLLSLVPAVVYLFLLPYLWVRTYHKRYAPFIRCHHCGDWFGWDASGAYSGPNPRWRIVSETGRCYSCGSQVLRDL